jgi:hypothetical protein
MGEIIPSKNEMVRPRFSAFVLRWQKDHFSAISMGFLSKALPKRAKELIGIPVSFHSQLGRGIYFWAIRVTPTLSPLIRTSTFSWFSVDETRDGFRRG